MADLRTDTGRNRCVRLFALPLTISLEAPRAEIGQRGASRPGVDRPDAADDRAAQGARLRQPTRYRRRRLLNRLGCRPSVRPARRQATPWPRLRRPKWSFA